jgi:4-hydroxybenzoyl-CoA reductase beta subunit
MRLPPFQYLSPGTVKEALDMLHAHKGKLRITAGGTDIVNRLRQRLVTPSYVMSLKDLPELRGIKKKKSELVISAGTSLREIAEDPDVCALFSAVALSAGLVAAPPIRNIASLGGNILQETRCLFYDQSELVRKAALPCLKQGGKVCLAQKGAARCLSVYQGDLAPALIAFDAKAVLKKAGASRTVPVLALFSGKGKQPFTVEDDELLAQVAIPVPKGRYGASYEKLRMRKGLDYPFACAAAFVSLSAKGVIDRARLVVSAVGPAPVLVEEASAFMVGRTPADADCEAAAACAVKSAHAIDNLALPAAYRRKMVKVVARRAINSALGALSGAGA